jgi:hypothetical protein
MLQSFILYYSSLYLFLKKEKEAYKITLLSVYAFVSVHLCVYSH